MSSRHLVVSLLVSLVLLPAWAFPASYTSQNIIPGGGVMDDKGNVVAATNTTTNVTTSGRVYAVATPTSTNALIRVTGLFCNADGTTTVKFYSNGVQVSPTLSLTTNAVATMPFNPLGWFQGTASYGLEMSSSGSSVGVGCTLIWQLY